MDNKTKCPKSGCLSTSFELYNEKTVGDDVLFTVVRCYQCKTAIGALEHADIQRLLMQIIQKLDSRPI